MQRAKVFRAKSVQLLGDAINAFFIANAAFTGVSVTMAQVAAGYEAIVMYTP